MQRDLCFIRFQSDTELEVSYSVCTVFSQCMIQTLILYLAPSVPDYQDFLHIDNTTGQEICRDNNMTVCEFEVNLRKVFKQ